MNRYRDFFKNFHCKACHTAKINTIILNGLQKPKDDGCCWYSRFIWLIQELLLHYVPIDFLKKYSSATQSYAILLESNSHFITAASEGVQNCNYGFQVFLVLADYLYLHIAPPAFYPGSLTKVESKISWQATLHWALKWFSVLGEYSSIRSISIIIEM